MKGSPDNTTLVVYNGQIYKGIDERGLNQMNFIKVKAFTLTTEEYYGVSVYELEIEPSIIFSEAFRVLTTANNIEFIIIDKINPGDTQVKALIDKEYSESFKDWISKQVLPKHKNTGGF